MITDERILEEAIRLVDDGVSVTLPVKGQSMLPFIIGGKESVILTKPLHAQVGDIVWKVAAMWSTASFASTVSMLR